MDQKETDIIEQLRSGDKSAFEAVFKEYYPVLCNYARKYTDGDMDSAEEIVQDVFYKMWEKQSFANFSGSVSAFLFTSVRNSCLNHIKHLKIQEKFRAYQETNVKNSEQEYFEAAEYHELEEKIYKAIAELPEQRRKIFEMNRFEGLKYREIAEKLDLSIKTVETQMSKALKFMKKELEGYMKVIIYIIFYIFSNFF